MLQALDAAVAESLGVIGLAGVAIVGVVVAVKAIDWLKLVIIEREASRDQMQWERDRT